ncbi:hypothetical protein JHK86_042592 [Glycine max]|nr:hypothetical protein JHK86_042592 [Glycine max]
MKPSSTYVNVDFPRLTPQDRVLLLLCRSQVLRSLLESISSKIPPIATTPSMAMAMAKIHVKNRKKVSNLLQNITSHANPHTASGHVLLGMNLPIRYQYGECSSAHPVTAIQA